MSVCTFCPFVHVMETTGQQGLVDQSPFAGIYLFNNWESCIVTTLRAT